MTDAEITVRRLSPDDWTIERDLRIAALADAPAAFGSRLSDAEGFSEADWRSRLSGQLRFTAWLNDEPVGTVGFAAAKDPYPAGTAILVGMWIAPFARGLGVANRLVAAVVEQCRRDGMTAIWLSVSDGNVVAERLYARHGFARSGTDLEGDGDTFDMVQPLDQMAP